MTCKLRLFCRGSAWKSNCRPKPSQSKSNVICLSVCLSVCVCVCVCLFYLCSSLSICLPSLSFSISPSLFHPTLSTRLFCLPVSLSISPLFASCSVPLYLWVRFGRDPDPVDPSIHSLRCTLFLVALCCDLFDHGELDQLTDPNTTIELSCALIWLSEH